MPLGPPSSAVVEMAPSLTGSQFISSNNQPQKSSAPFTKAFGTFRKGLWHLTCSVGQLKTIMAPSCNIQTQDPQQFIRVINTSATLHMSGESLRVSMKASTRTIAMPILYIFLVIYTVYLLWILAPTNGYKYLYYKKLHNASGPYVWTGPNKISVIDAVAVCQILGYGSLKKGWCQ
ncbi:hypothetical protein B0H14DRAFT_2584367 [Mycena olivaceomarginata]|nr:hypothetical protein B0H14DRAFT_2584367 [Mycena olivaceomarginata]